MTNPAFLVDGQTEKLAIEKVCPGKPIRILALNGKSVSALAIAKRAETQIRLLTGKHYPFILITDLEDRKISHSTFADQIEKELKKLGVKEQVIIGVADRMIENWIFCDPDCVGTSAKGCDGQHGASLLKKALGSYHKTTTGAELLARARASELKKSPSFAAFDAKLGRVNCGWLRR